MLFGEFIAFCIEKALAEFDRRFLLKATDEGQMQGECVIATNGDLLFERCTFPHVVDVALFGMLITFDAETWTSPYPAQPVATLPDYMRGTYAGTL